MGERADQIINQILPKVQEKQEFSTEQRSSVWAGI